MYYKGLASTISEARQLVTHGHIVIGDQKVTIPSYFVQRDEEELIAYHRDSALQDENHRIRRSIDTRRRDIADSGSEEEAKVATQPYGKEDVQQITEDLQRPRLVRIPSRKVRHDDPQGDREHLLFEQQRPDDRDRSHGS